MLARRDGSFATTLCFFQPRFSETIIARIFSNNQILLVTSAKNITNKALIFTGKNSNNAKSFQNLLLVSIGTLMAPPICGLMEPLKIVILALKQGDYFSLFAPRPVCSFVSRNLR